jgi:hypothetical protein
MSGRRPGKTERKSRKPKMVVESMVKLRTSGISQEALNALIADYKHQGYEVVGSQGTRQGGVTLVRKKAVATAANVDDLADLFGGIGLGAGAAAAAPAAAAPNQEMPADPRFNALVAGLGGLGLGQGGGKRSGRKRSGRKTMKRRRS